MVNVPLTVSHSEEDYGIILPDIGDPASALLSVNQEIELGKILFFFFFFF